MNDENLFYLCSEYKKEKMLKVLDYVSLNMRLDLITAKEVDE
jgi:hypothetical protein